MKRFFSATLMLVVLVNHHLAAQPVISNITPLGADTGATVTISGSGFNATSANLRVFINGTPAVITASSTTSIAFRVPQHAVYGPVTVTNISTGLAGVSRLSFGTTFPCGGDISSESFAKEDNFNFGFNSTGVSVGDMDNDGHPDLVYSGAYPTNGLVIYRNMGLTGPISISSFSARNIIYATRETWRNALADLDGDGRLDIAASAADTAVLVFRNTGTPANLAFDAPLKLASGLAPGTVVTGDLNSDGKSDIAVCNYASGTISIFLNTGVSGAPAFASKQDFAVGVNPRDLVLQDIDNDGRLDLTVSNQTDTTVSILRNTGTGSTLAFAPAVNLKAYNHPNGLVFGDLNGDAKPDLCVANERETSNVLSIFRNTSTSGAVSFAARKDFIVGSMPHKVALGDVNGDGRPDIAVSWGSTLSPTVGVLDNRSSIDSLIFIYASSALSGAQFMTFGDFNGDGKPDLAGNKWTNDITVAENTTAGLIIMGSADATICPGANTTFYIRIINDNTAVRQWQVDSGSGYVNITNNSTYSGATSDTLRITGAAAGMNNFQYRCKITRSSCPAPQYSVASKLIVYPVASITANPVDLTLCQAKKGRFSVAAAGSGLSYRWYYNTGSGFTYVPQASPFDSVFSPTLIVLTAYEFLNNSKFYCHVTGICGPTVISSAATLTVISTNPIAQHPASVSVNEGVAAGFSVSAAGTGLTYQWQSDARGEFTNILGSGAYSGVQTPTLSINPTAYTMDGRRFRCKVTNLCDSSFSNPATLVVNSRPRIQVEPHDTAYCTGDTISFHISATGTGLTYQWQRLAAEWTDLAVSALYSGSTTPALTMNGVPKTLDSARFRVIVAGTINPPDTSNAARCIWSCPTVKSAPAGMVRIVEFNVSTNTCAGNMRIQMHCKNGAAHLAVFNLNGKKVFTDKTLQRGMMVRNLFGLNPGVYWVDGHNGERAYRKKVFLLR